MRPLDRRSRRERLTRLSVSNRGARGAAGPTTTLGLLDQLAYSLSTAVLLVLAARALPAGEFGRFSSWQLGAVLVLALSRCTFAQPLAVVYPTRLGEIASAAANATSSAVATGAVVASVIALITTAAS